MLYILNKCAFFSKSTLRLAQFQMEAQFKCTSICLILKNMILNAIFLL